MRSILSICLMAVALSLSLDGLAEKGDKQKALEAFNKGIAYYKSGNMEKAVVAFRRADALNPSWKIQYNIGQCEASLRRYGLAIDAFEMYLGQGGDEVPTERRDEVLKELDRLRKMVGTISVTGEPDVDIYVDVVKYGNTSSRNSVKVTAGVEHEISFVKDGRKLGSVRVVVSGGEVVVLPVGGQNGTAVAVAASPVAQQPAGTETPTIPSAQAAVSPDPVSVPAAMPQYTNMRQIKIALRAGQITRDDYRRYQMEIRKRRAEEYDALKADLRARKITEREYEQRIREVRKKYEGD